MTFLVRLLGVLALMTAAGCATMPPTGGPGPARPDEIAELARSIQAMDPQIDPEEARRAARVAYEETHRLAIAYQITDGPIVHNTKVNMGLRPRGLCKHWAEDMEARLEQERFTSLELHRAIANADNPFRLEHSTVIISSRGASMYDGIVLDPWRQGGVLFWSTTRADTDYGWQPRRKVLEQKRLRAMKEARLAAARS